ncbi:MAG: hypothetical protein WD360_02670 [Nitriliruptoraceae bacterium]
MNTSGTVAGRIVILAVLAVVTVGLCASLAWARSDVPTSSV